jgi:hypothetical protein
MKVVVVKGAMKEVALKGESHDEGGLSRGELGLNRPFEVGSHDLVAKKMGSHN